MISNERQYKITKSQLRKLKEAAAEYDIDSSVEQLGSEILAAAELEALKSEIDVLHNQMLEYEKLKSGKKITLKATGLAELARILIQARIVRNLSQRELAERVGLKEQQIQRYESEAYASASLRRLMEITKALQIDITETANLNPLPQSTNTIPTEVFD